MLLPCPHCHERPASLDTHLRFECPKLVGRRRYTPPAGSVTETLTNRLGQTYERTYLPSLESALPKFFEDVEKFLDSQP